MGRSTTQLDRPTIDGAAIARWGARATTATAVACLLLLLASLEGATPGVGLGPGGEPWLAVSVDRLAALLLVLVTVVSAVVQSYAIRYLRHDPDQGRFVAQALGLTVAMMTVVGAATLLTLATGWVASGLLVALLVAVGRDGTDGFGAEVRRVRRTLLGGDAALIVAVGLLLATAGNVRIQDADALRAAADDAGAWIAVVVGLVAVAALVRCAQLPFCEWLPPTLGAPTPVSALLHAGVVNGGGFLLVRLSPLVDGWAPGWWLVAVAGGATALWGAVVMSVSTDVKGALVRSTTAQMGFMLVTVAAGLPAAAMTHLVAHGMYKAALFLGAGGAVHDAVTYRSLPARSHHASTGATRVVVAVLFPAATFAALAVVFDLHANELALVVFAWATVATALWGWLGRRRDTRSIVVAGAAVVVGSLAYVALIERLADFLAPAITPALGGPGVAALLALATGAAAIAVVQVLPVRFPTLHTRLYVLALSATHASPTRKGTS